ncbi:MAG: hypothetical protein U0802_25620 [Candidatus Binatia bacterium]
MRHTRHRLWALGLAAALSVAPLRAALGIGIEDVVDGGNTYAWTKVEIPGTICSDGSQYRFWYYDNPSSTSMVISFEAAARVGTTDLQRPGGRARCRASERHPG